MNSKKTLRYALLGTAAVFGLIGLFTQHPSFLLAAGCCVFGWWHTTPAGYEFRKEQAKLNAARRKDQERFRAEQRKITPQYLHQLFDKLVTSPSNRDLCDEIVRTMQISNPFVIPESATREFYDRALQVLTDNPDITYLKQFCLSVGRWYCGRNRSDGKVTIYDEQAIQNDINVRAK